MLRSLLNSALRGGGMSGRRGTTGTGMGTGMGSGMGGGMGAGTRRGGAAGGGLGGMIGRTLLSNLSRRR